MNFSLYRGNLHKVPDVPRKWALAKPSIPLHLFQKAIAKRHEAIQRLHASEDQPEGDALFNEQESCKSLHDEDHEAEKGKKRKREDMEVSGMEIEGDDLKSVEDVGRSSSERKPRLHCEADLGTMEGREVDGMECDPSLPNVTCNEAKETQMEDVITAAGGLCCAEEDLPAENKPACVESFVGKDFERLEAPRTPAAKDEECAKPAERISRELDCSVPLAVSTTVEHFVAGKKAEIQETLKQLQETKHQLVQILKQVLINEEESRRKSQLLQYPAAYATVGTLDLPLDQKTGSEMQSTDLEEGELEYTRNSGPPVVALTYGSHFSVQPLTTSVTLGRQFVNSQQLNRP